MRIAINLLYLLPGVVGGTETYAAGLLNGLSQIESPDEFVVFVNRESASWPIPQSNKFSQVICSVGASNRARRYFYEQVHLPRLLKEYAIDVVHSLGYVGPLRTPCPGVVTVPDLNYLAIGHTMPAYKRLILKMFSTQAAKNSAAVITISEFSKAAICEKSGMEPGKVFVTLLGPRWNRDAEPEPEARELLEKYGVKEPYWAAFGGGSVHKNICRLLQAYSQLRGRFSRQLLLIGHLPADVHSGSLPEGVVATGYVPDEHVFPLLSGAEVFVLPSLYEGFGLPVLEAQQVGVPVVCSTAGSLPEVAGDGAVFFDPYSVQDLVEKTGQVVLNKELREKLRRMGLQNCQRFSWGQTALETVAVYKRVYQARRTS